MEALELLGSRYIKPEQLAAGPVETLRAQNAATWRVVFIHRVSTTQEATEQANLLKLLTTALVRSSEAKRLVLDFGEEQGFWNVITESEPQCESLRDWLQAEVDGAEKGEAILSAEQAAAMGEFARLFARGAKLPPRKAVKAREPKPAIAPVAPPTAPKTPEPVPPAAPTPLAEQPPAVAEEPVQPPVPPVVEELAPQPESGLPEPETPAQDDEEQLIVVADEIPVIVISTPPPPNKAMAATQSIGESKPSLGDANAPLPPRPFLPPRPPLGPLPVEPPSSTLPAFTEERGSQAALGSPDALNAGAPRSALPAFTEEPLIPEIVTELPKAVADPPKVVPIDGRPHEPKVETPKSDAVRTEPPLAQSDARPKPPARDDAPLFANSMPKPARLSKMAVFFIILGIVALLLILVIVYLSNKT